MNDEAELLDFDTTFGVLTTQSGDRFRILRCKLDGSGTIDLVMLDELVVDDEPDEAELDALARAAQVVLEGVARACEAGRWVQAFVQTSAGVVPFRSTRWATEQRAIAVIAGDPWEAAAVKIRAITPAPETLTVPQFRALAIVVGTWHAELVRTSATVRGDA